MNNFLSIPISGVKIIYGGWCECCGDVGGKCGVVSHSSKNIQL